MKRRIITLAIDLTDEDVDCIVPSDTIWVELSRLGSDDIVAKKAEILSLLEFVEPTTTLLYEPIPPHPVES